MGENERMCFQTHHILLFRFNEKQRNRCQTQGTPHCPGHFKRSSYLGTGMEKAETSDRVNRSSIGNEARQPVTIILRE